MLTFGRRAFLAGLLPVTLLAFVLPCRADDGWSSWATAEGGPVAYRWRSVFNSYSGEHKEIQFRNSGSAQVSFTWTASSDNAKYADTFGMVLGASETSQIKTFQLKGDVTSVAVKTG
jgi:hypothetical protein